MSPLPTSGGTVRKARKPRVASHSSSFIRLPHSEIVKFRVRCSAHQVNRISHSGRPHTRQVLCEARRAEVTKFGTSIISYDWEMDIATTR